MKYKKSIFALLFFAMLLVRVNYLNNTYNSLKIYSSNNQNIKEKLDKQGNDIYDKLQEQPKSGDKLKDNIDFFNSNNRNSKGEFKGINIYQPFLKIAIEGRKYVAPLYIIYIMVYTLLLSWIGAKSIEKRRAYVLTLIIITIIFIVFLNLPIIFIYFKYNPITSVLSSGKVLQSLYSLINFFKSNSIAIFSILFIYGIITRILSKNDLPRYLASRYILQTSVVLLIVMQILPLLINFIL